MGCRMKTTRDAKKSRCAKIEAGKKGWVGRLRNGKQRGIQPSRRAADIPRSDRVRDTRAIVEPSRDDRKMAGPSVFGLSTRPGGQAVKSAFNRQGEVKDADDEPASPLQRNDRTKQAVVFEVRLRCCAAGKCSCRSAWWICARKERAKESECHCE